MDAAIIFSDILVVPQAMGLTVEMLPAKVRLQLATLGFAFIKGCRPYLTYRIVLNPCDRFYLHFALVILTIFLGWIF